MKRLMTLIMLMLVAWPEMTGAAANPGTPSASPTPGTGAIVGLVTIAGTKTPVAGVYITVGYKGIKLAGITGADGRYRVDGVPPGEAADVFGFHGGGYRYHNSIYDDHLKIVLQSGQTYAYNFTVAPLNDPAGEPEVVDPAIAPKHAHPGDTVTFALTARGGKGGLSDEVFAASPALGRLVLLAPTGGDRFRGTLIVPAGTKPGDYPFAFFAASNACYDNHVFPMLVLRIDGP